MSQSRQLTLETGLGDENDGECKKLLDRQTPLRSYLRSHGFD